MTDSLLTKVALAGWNDTDPLSLAKARAVLQVVRDEIEATPISRYAPRIVAELLEPFPEEAG